MPRFQLGNCSDCCQKLLSWRCRTVLQWKEIGEQCSIRSHKNAKPWWFLLHQVPTKLQECSIHGTFWKKIHSWTEPWPEWVTLESAFVVLWFVETDELGFKIRDLNRPETKRGILSSTCSLYDLLGFAASKTIKSSCAVDMYKMLIEKMDLPIKCTK